MASSFFSSLRALARVIGVPAKRSAVAAALMARRAAGDMPRQAPPEAAEAYRPVRVGGDGVPGKAVAGRLAVRPGDEVLDPVPERARLQGAGAFPGSGKVVGLVVE